MDDMDDMDNMCLVVVLQKCLDICCVRAATLMSMVDQSLTSPTYDVNYTTNMTNSIQ